jgi:hypothetical protein
MPGFSREQQFSGTTKAVRKPNGWRAHSLVGKKPGLWISLIAFCHAHRQRFWLLVAPLERTLSVSREGLHR